MQLIDGKRIAEEIKAEIKAKVDAMKSQGLRPPHLAAILVGHDGGSETYVAHKVKDCEQVGFLSTLIRYEDHVTEEELLCRIDSLNADSCIDGFIVRIIETYRLTQANSLNGKFASEYCHIAFRVMRMSKATIITAIAREYAVPYNMFQIIK